MIEQLWLSLRIAIAAVTLVILVGVPLALFMSRRNFFGKSIVEALIVVPLVLPPTVVGYLILVIFGTRGLVGRWLHSALGYSMIFRIESAILAAAVVSLPLLYLPAKAAFASIVRELEDMARVMGAGWWQLLWHVRLPLARRGLLAGIVLALARALGEFGATVMVFGMQPRRLTLPIAVYLDFESGELSHAAGAVAVLCALSVALIFTYNAVIRERAE